MARVRADTEKNIDRFAGLRRIGIVERMRAINPYVPGATNREVMPQTSPLTPILALMGSGVAQLFLPDGFLPWVSKDRRTGPAGGQSSADSGSETARYWASKR